jgi:hypothetical protein
MSWFHRFCASPRIEVRFGDSLVSSPKYSSMRNSRMRPSACLLARLQAGVGGANRPPELPGVDNFDRLVRLAHVEQIARRPLKRGPGRQAVEEFFHHAKCRSVR